MAVMIFELEIELEDGKRYTVVADQRDVARWEVQPFGFPIVKFAEQASMTLFRFLGWSASVRQGHTDLSWDDFNAKCVEVMPPDDEEGEGAPADAEDPGQPAPSDTPS